VDRLIGTVVLLLVTAVALPTIAAVAQEAIPALVLALVLLGLIHSLA
jgi:hypothetical protein